LAFAPFVEATLALSVSATLAPSVVALSVAIAVSILEVFFVFLDFLAFSVVIIAVLSVSFAALAVLVLVLAVALLLEKLYFFVNFLINISLFSIVKSKNRAFILKKR
jgi:hypothetical protein